MTDEHQVEVFNERAAIREYDGGLPRKEAEEKAYWDLRKQLGQGVPVAKAIQETLAASRKKQKELFDLGAHY